MFLHVSVCVTVWLHLAIGLNGDNDTDDDTCKPLSKSDYIYLVWTTCAEFPGQSLPLM